MMTSAELSRAARTLLVEGSTQDRSAGRIAARAEETCETLSRHLARLLGDMGARALLTRSMVLTRTRFPWLGDAGDGAAGPRGSEPPWKLLRASMEHRDPEIAVEAYAAFLSTLIQLLGRLIGDSLVSRLLQEIWPKVFRTQ